MASVYLMRHGEADYEPIRERGWPGGVADLAPLTALGDALSALASHEVVIVVCHQMVIWSLNGHRETSPGQWRLVTTPAEP
jgi:broad specificity phosphatase PhoE